MTAETHRVRDMSDAAGVGQTRINGGGYGSKPHAEPPMLRGRDMVLEATFTQSECSAPRMLVARPRFASRCSASSPRHADGRTSRWRTNGAQKNTASAGQLPDKSQHQDFNLPLFRTKIA